MAQLKQRLHDMETRLGAWMCRDEDFADNQANPPEFESKARTFLCFLENVFGRFYEFKTRICDYDDIPDTYGVDWDLFQKDVCEAAKENRPFNGICAVMHIQTASGSSGEYIIQNIGLRPCVIEQSFFRVLLKHIAQSLPQGTKLVIKVFGIRVEFVNTVISNLKEGIPTFTEPPRKKEDKMNFMGHATSFNGHTPQVDVITLDSAHIEALKNLKVPWTKYTDAGFPSASALNNSKMAQPKRIGLIRRMISLAQTQFAEYLNRTNDSTNYLPDALNLDENGLWVYKNGLKLGFCPEERRFFKQKGTGGYLELYLDRENVPRASIDSMQARSTIRMELAGGKYVFFIKPQDFVRGNVENKQVFSLEDDINVKKFIKSLILSGEKIVGIYSTGIVMTSHTSTAVVVYNPGVNNFSKESRIEGPEFSDNSYESYDRNKQRAYNDEPEF